MVAMVRAVVVALAVAVALVSGGGEVVVLVVLLAAVVVEHRASGEASWMSCGGELAPITVAQAVDEGGPAWLQNRGLWLPAMPISRFPKRLTLDGFLKATR